MSAAIALSLRTAALVPVISDFLFDGALDVVGELALVDATHDVFVVLVDSRWAFAAPPLSAGWIAVHDVEGGGPRVVSRRVFRGLAERAAERQAEVVRAARDAGLDVVILGPDDRAGALALAGFVAERRLRRVTR